MMDCDQFMKYILTAGDIYLMRQVSPYWFPRPNVLDPALPVPQGR